MAKGSGSAGRGRGGGKGGSGGKGKGDDGWTRSVWDVRQPGEKPKPEKAKKPASQMIDKALRLPANPYGRTITNEMRHLQNQLRDLAKQRGYKDDDPIPGTGGLTIRKLTRNAASRGAQEGEMRAAISALLRDPHRRARPARPSSAGSRAQPTSASRPSRPAVGPIEIPLF